MSRLADQVYRQMDMTVPSPPDGVEDTLRQFLDQRPLPENLADAIRYCLLAKGKRLRPIMVIRSCQAVGGRAESAMAPAAAIEMIHCFSLVHDDLPALDDDDLRRGRPTLHKHTNEAMAILAGDAMMGLAFELVSTRLRSCPWVQKIIAELSVATNNMIVGQVYDTLGDFADQADARSRLMTTHRHKTGALIRCACRMGAICAGADSDQLEAITTYGQSIGLMYQVVDDLLDVTQTTEQLGKAAHKDADQGKLTYPSVYGVEGCRCEIDRLRDQAQSSIRTLGHQAQPLIDLCQYLSARTR